MKHIILSATCLLILAGNLLYAQNKHFTTSGTIEFDKTANMYAILQKAITKDNEFYAQPAFDQFKKNNPQFRTLKSTLTFGGNRTLFTPIEFENTSDNFFVSNPIVNQNNTIFSDFNNSSIINQKNIFDETFLVKDSTRKINWKITSETREIAGYTCRRANAVILDSIYVVAFYTDEITVTGGPESFNGLPGMILGVALPHENITWFATKVTDTPVEEKALTPPKKGKPATNKTLMETMLSFMKDWGNDSKSRIKGFTL